MRADNISPEKIIESEEPETGTKRTPWQRCLLMTELQRQILSMIAEGQEIKQIAFALQISESMVKTHSWNAQRVLTAKNRAHATAIWTEFRLRSTRLDESEISHRGE